LEDGLAVGLSIKVVVVALKIIPANAGMVAQSGILASSSSILSLPYE
jgi:hypothetical protein